MNFCLVQSAVTGRKSELLLWTSSLNRPERQGPEAVVMAWGMRPPLCKLICLRGSGNTEGANRGLLHWTNGRKWCLLQTALVKSQSAVTFIIKESDARCCDQRRARTPREEHGIGLCHLHSTDRCRSTGACSTLGWNVVGSSLKRPNISLSAPHARHLRARSLDTSQVTLLERLVICVRSIAHRQILSDGDLLYLAERIGERSVRICPRHSSYFECCFD
jgi:hypothetical protein